MTNQGKWVGSGHVKRVSTISWYKVGGRYIEKHFNHDTPEELAELKRQWAIEMEALEKESPP